VNSNESNEERITQVCHAVNKAYCEALGDNSQTAWIDAAQWQKDSAVAGVQLHLSNPEAGPAASHEAWMRHKVAEGWEYGPVKDPSLKQHPCLVPFEQLPPEQQMKDWLFRAVVHAVADLLEGIHRESQMWWGDLRERHEKAASALQSNRQALRDAASEIVDLAARIGRSIQ